MRIAADQPQRDELEMRRDRPPRVSIGMPVFDSQKYLPAAIESILRQSYYDLELIICDNASTDRSFSICEEFAARDSRVRVLRNPVNLGANPNYRKVAKAARGELFKWASANDIIDSDYVAQCVALLDRRADVVLAFGRTEVFEEDLRQCTPYDDRMDIQDDDPVVRFRRCVESLRLNNVINGLIRSADLRRTALMPDYLSSDNVVLAQLALAGKFAEVPTTRFFRRMERESATRLQSPEMVRRHHYPTDRIERFFQSWQLTSGYFAATMRSRLPFSQQLRVLMYVARQTYWHSPRLLADLREAFRFYVMRNRR